jgi:hypothetical protein
MIEPEHLASNLPELDRTDDPRGGAAAWALLTVGMALIAGLAGIFLAMMRVVGAW